MKIHTRTVWDFATGEKLEDEWHEYDGPVAQAKKGSSKNQTVTQTQRYDPAIAPYIGSLSIRAYNEAKKPRTFFPGSTVADFTPGEQSAFEAIRSRAGASPLLDQASDYASRSVGGEYLTGGPGWNAVADAITRTVAPRVNSQFALAGRGGAPLSQMQIAREVAQPLAALYGQERQLQQNMAGALPQIEAAKYSDPQALLASESAVRAQEQARINEAIARHDFAQDEALQRYQTGLGMLTSAYAPTIGSSKTTPYSRNWATGALGGALGAGGLAAAAKMSNPWIAGLAAGGALLGSLG